MRALKSAIKSFIMYCKKEKVKPVIIPTDNDRILEGKVALITGGSSGIGLAIAKEFLSRGAKVIIAGTNIKHLENAVDDLKKLPGGGKNCKAVLLDVRDDTTLEDKIKESVALFQENRLDILVNSAGVTSKTDFFHTTPADYDRIMDINTRGTFFVSQAVGKFMIANGMKGHILNVTSSSALRPAWTPYEISKWAVRGMTLGLADILLPYGIVVNAIAPGPTATAMLEAEKFCTISNDLLPGGRYALPEEIAALAVFMVSGAGDMVVGDTFYITGGSGLLSLHH